MSLISLVCFAVCVLAMLTWLRRGSDILSPGRILIFVWCFAIALAELKLSRYQHEWSSQSWILLGIGVLSFLVGVFIVFVIHLSSPMTPIPLMRRVLSREQVREGRLFWFICASVAVYAISYLIIYLVKGFLPVFVVGGKLSRVDFYVFGFGVLINSTAFIIFFTLLYFLLVHGHTRRKVFLLWISSLAVGSYFLLLQRFQIVMAAVLCFTLLYYATNLLRARTAFFFSLAVAGFFYWISSLRLRHLFATWLYFTSKMRLPTELAFLTEPYMYIVMNLENFARGVAQLDHFTFGYFTLDFLVSLTGLEKLLAEYFAINRTPYLVSGYNTYTAFWTFYRDFGVFGLLLIPLVLGLISGTLYYRMRRAPTIENVAAYGVMVFVMLISFFNFPLAMLWFLYNVLALYVGLRWIITSRKNTSYAGVVPAITSTS